MKRVVIVGAGQGGFQAAASLRQEGFSGDITLIGDEPEIPYQRPPLSKAYLKSAETPSLSLRPSQFYQDNAIALRLGSWVRAIDRANARVEINGEHIAYDHLILATGSRNLRPPIPGVQNTIGLRNLADAKALKVRMRPGMRIGIIGGGFIGLEFAAVARAMGCEVTVAEAAPRLMARAVSTQMSALFAQKHRDLGVEILLGDGAVEIDKTGFTLSSGQRVECDLILLAAGVVPNTELASLVGLDVDNGICVDEHLLTADPTISALGDCASFPDPLTGRLIRLESVQAATDHARLIAKRITQGHADPYRAVPWFWSDQADWKLQIAGLADPSDAAVQVNDSCIIRLQGHRVTAVETINNAKAHMKARKLMSSGEMLWLADFSVGHAEVQGQYDKQNA
ncbi:NAD(P)/FAD-dependent oxidoreductase [Loktanella sp. S4079]|uniref:NAD(P)/FAD-dependent oxidoreductase n=1 Tax=Loktanella sp. S4079 TaxID=579483 RepID=UPI0005F9BA8D|nr:FAD-dependent oxidoreductase [Loktanella sp. S4079]